MSGIIQRIKRHTGVVVLQIVNLQYCICPQGNAQIPQQFPNNEILNRPTSSLLFHYMFPSNIMDTLFCQHCKNKIELGSFNELYLFYFFDAANNRSISLLYVFSGCEIGCPSRLQTRPDLVMVLRDHFSCYFFVFLPYKKVQFKCKRKRFTTFQIDFCFFFYLYFPIL